MLFLSIVQGIGRRTPIGQQGECCVGHGKVDLLNIGDCTVDTTLQEVLRRLCIVDEFPHKVSFQSIHKAAHMVGRLWCRLASANVCQDLSRSGLVLVPSVLALLAWAGARYHDTP